MGCSSENINQSRFYEETYIKMTLVLSCWFIKLLLHAYNFHGLLVMMHSVRINFATNLFQKICIIALDKLYIWHYFGKSRKPVCKNKVKRKGFPQLSSPLGERGVGTEAYFISGTAHERWSLSPSPFSALSIPET